MLDEDIKPLSAFGFLTVIEDSQHGFFGGYLTVSTLGRPLEFHCTTPILPNPAQRILYGASLRTYLLGELIGLTLLEKAKTPVRLILTDQPEVLTQSAKIATPITWVQEAESTTDDAKEKKLHLGRYWLSTTEEASNVTTLRELLEPLAEHVDLAEPFQRIREAIDEAQRISEPPEEPGDESAAAA